MATIKGDRVGAISHTEDGKAYFYGYGVYEGDFVPEEAVGAMPDMLRELEIPNPRIKLDNGSVVYGCECWWGPEEKIQSQLKDVEVVPVSIGDTRQEYIEKNGN